jgi:hypothetical protein
MSATVPAGLRGRTPGRFTVDGVEAKLGVSESASIARAARRLSFGVRPYGPEPREREVASSAASVPSPHATTPWATGPMPPVRSSARLYPSRAETRSAVATRCGPSALTRSPIEIIDLCTSIPSAATASPETERTGAAIEYKPGASLDSSSW